ALLILTANQANAPRDDRGIANHFALLINHSLPFSPDQAGGSAVRQDGPRSAGLPLEPMSTTCQGAKASAECGKLSSIQLARPVVERRQMPRQPGRHACPVGKLVILR